MYPITRDISLPEEEVTFDFIRASGPGGQNVNKVSTAVQLRFDIARSPSVPDHVKHRLVELGGRRVTSDGVLVLDARRQRTQRRNRDEAVERLVELIREAARPVRTRRKTRPSRAARRRRSEAKRQRGETKRLRRRVEGD